MGNAINLEKRTVVIAKNEEKIIEAPLTSGELQKFFAANRVFDEQMFFMNLVRTKACSDDIIDREVAEVLDSIRVPGDESARIAEIGESLFGHNWVVPMADVLFVDERTVRRWKSGSNIVPPGVWDELKVLLLRRNTAASALLARIL